MKIEINYYLRDYNHTYDHRTAFTNANALSSPSVETGSNPIISSTCTSTYTVPSDQILVITDFVAYGTSASAMSLSLKKMVHPCSI